MAVYYRNSRKLLIAALSLVSAFQYSHAVNAQNLKELDAQIAEAVNGSPTPDTTELKSPGDEAAMDLEAPKGNEVELKPAGDYVFDNRTPGRPTEPVSTDDGGPVIAGPSAITESDIGADAFYDTEAILPKGKVGVQGPAPVTPSMQPASRLVIVEKMVPANDKSSQVVAAQRAMALGRYESALLILDKLYEKNKKDTQILMNRAISLQKLERYDEAMQVYEELSKLEPKNIDVSINMLGLLATRYPSIALRRLMDLGDENPDNIGLIGQIAVTSANLGDFDTALRYLGMAMGMQPENANHVFNAAVILDRAGKTKEAVTYYEKALEIDSVYGANRSVPREVIYERLARIR